MVLACRAEGAGRSLPNLGAVARTWGRLDAEGIRGTYLAAVGMQSRDRRVEGR